MTITRKRVNVNSRRETLTMEYLTVSQFAKISGKDSGNIRRMLIDGRLEGKKIGNQWVIPETAVYPSDRRVKSGQYKNWRKKPAIWYTHPELMQALLEMSKKISDVYSTALKNIVVYGSYARGEETEESDVDIALILKDSETEEMHDKMTDIVVDYELDQNRTLSVVTIDNSNYVQWRKVLPFYKNLDKEGVVIWKAQ